MNIASDVYVIVTTYISRSRLAFGEHAYLCETVTLLRRWSTDCCFWMVTYSASFKTMTACSLTRGESPVNFVYPQRQRKNDRKLEWECLVFTSNTFGSLARLISLLSLGKCLFDDFTRRHLKPREHNLLTTSTTRNSVNDHAPTMQTLRFML